MPYPVKFLDKLNNPKTFVGNLQRDLLSEQIQPEDLLYTNDGMTILHQYVMETYIPNDLDLGGFFIDKKNCIDDVFRVQDKNGTTIIAYLIDVYLNEKYHPSTEETEAQKLTRESYGGIIKTETQQDLHERRIRTIGYLLASLASELENGNRPSDIYQVKGIFSYFWRTGQYKLIFKMFFKRLFQSGPNKPSTPLINQATDTPIDSTKLTEYDRKVDPNSKRTTEKTPLLPEQEQSPKQSLSD